MSDYDVYCREMESVVFLVNMRVFFYVASAIAASIVFYPKEIFFS